MKHDYDEILKVLIQQRMKTLDITYTELAKISKVSKSTIHSYITYPDKSINIKSLVNICNALNINTYDVLEIIGLKSDGLGEYYPRFKTIILNYLKNNNIEDEMFSDDDFEFIQKVLMYIASNKMHKNN